MGGRYRPRWAEFEGGPMNGARRVLRPNEDEVSIQHTPAAAGMRTPHEYRRTDDVRKGAERNSASARVYVYVRSLPAEPIPIAPTGHGPSPFSKS